jgi:putative sigma-54 modulation protein
MTDAPSADVPGVDVSSVDVTSVDVPAVGVVVFGKQFDVTPELRAFAEEKVRRVERFAADVRRVEIDFSETRNPRVALPCTCEILVHLTGHLVKAHASAGEPHAALDAALEKVERQLRRLHERRTSRRDSRRDGGPGRARANGASPEPTAEPEVPDTAAGPADAGAEPVIVKSKQFAVKPMVPQEAALQMELLGHDFFLFTNAENSRAAVVYRRLDGNLGLIEAAG